MYNNYAKHKTAYQMIQLGLTLMLLFMFRITFLKALNVTSNVVFFILLVIGIVFMLIGNFMPQIRFNYFLGIKTPWTLSDEEVWRKTHRMGGYIFIIMGAIVIVSAIVSKPIFHIISLASLLLGIIFIFFSYRIFVKIKNN